MGPSGLSGAGSFYGLHCCHRHPLHPLQHDALTREEQVRDGGAGREGRQERRAVVLARAEGGAVGREGVVAPGQRGRDILCLDGITEAGNDTLCQGDALVGFSVFEALVVVATLPYCRVEPRLAGIDAHRREKVDLTGVTAAILGHTAAHHDATDGAVGEREVPGTDALAVNKVVVVEIRKGVGFKEELHRQHATCVLHGIDTVTDDGTEDMRRLDPREGLGGMDITDECRCLILRAVGAVGRHDLTIADDEFVDLRATDDIPTLLPQLVDERTDEDVTVATEPPTALDETTVRVGEDEEGQGVARQFHAHGIT